MKIENFIKQFLDVLNPYLIKIKADQRCIGNIEHLLANDIFKRNKLKKEFNTHYRLDIYFKFSSLLDTLIAKHHYPQEALKKTLELLAVELQNLDKSVKLDLNPKTYEENKKHKEEKRKEMQRLVDVFVDTMKRVDSMPETKNAILKTRCYMTDKNGKGNLLVKNPGDKTSSIAKQAALPSIKKTTVSVQNVDCFNAAQDLLDKGYDRVLVHNLANRFSAGGGVTKGSKAQEEDQCRRSSEYRSISQSSLAFEEPAANKYLLPRRKYHEPIPEFGSIYADEVYVIKDDKYQLLKKPFKISTIAVAGYDLGKLFKLDESEKQNILDSQGEVSLDLFKKATMRKIRHLLDVAIAEGHTVLVLGGLSIGAFKLQGDTTGQTATAVANAFKEVLLEAQYQDKFEQVVFSVLDNAPTLNSNFTIFYNTLDNLQINKTSNPAVAPMYGNPSSTKPQMTGKNEEEIQPAPNQEEMNKERVSEKKKKAVKAEPPTSNQIKQQQSVKIDIHDEVIVSTLSKRAAFKAIPKKAFPEIVDVIKNMKADLVHFHEVGHQMFSDLMQEKLEKSGMPKKDAKSIADELVAFSLKENFDKKRSNPSERLK